MILDKCKTFESRGYNFFYYSSIQNYEEYFNTTFSQSNNCKKMLQSSKIQIYL